MPSKHDRILNTAESLSVDVQPCPLPRTIQMAYVRAQDDDVGGLIAVEEGLPECAQTCAIAEGLGHHLRTTGNQLLAAPREAQRQTQRARRWAHDALIPLEDLAEAALQYDGNWFAVAEMLGVTVAFLCEALRTFADRYGTQPLHTPRYTVIFAPRLMITPHQNATLAAPPWD